MVNNAYFQNYLNIEHARIQGHCFQLAYEFVEMTMYERNKDLNTRVVSVKSAVRTVLKYGIDRDNDNTVR